MKEQPGQLQKRGIQHSLYILCIKIQTFLKNISLQSYVSNIDGDLSEKVPFLWSVVMQQCQPQHYLRAGTYWAVIICTELKRWAVLRTDVCLKVPTAHLMMSQQVILAFSVHKKCGKPAKLINLLLTKHLKWAGSFGRPVHNTADTLWWRVKLLASFLFTTDCVTLHVHV